MWKCVWSACAVWMLWGLGAAPSCVAKPPDLPIDLGVDLEDTVPSGSITFGVDLITGQLSVTLAMPWQLLQSWFPQMLSNPAPIDANDAAAATSEGAYKTAAGSLPEDAALKEAQARKLFDIAERCVKNGDLDKARTCYEETHLLTPTSRLGRLAIRRLSVLDNARTGGAKDGAKIVP